jgi:hypothetical protein
MREFRAGLVGIEVANEDLVARWTRPGPSSRRERSSRIDANSTELTPATRRASSSVTSSTSRRTRTRPHAGWSIAGGGIPAASDLATEGNSETVAHAESAYAARARHRSVSALTVRGGSTSTRSAPGESSSSARRPSKLRTGRKGQRTKEDGSAPSTGATRAIPPLTTPTSDDGGAAASDVRSVASTPEAALSPSTRSNSGPPGPRGPLESASSWRREASVGNDRWLKETRWGSAGP